MPFIKKRVNTRRYNRVGFILTSGVYEIIHRVTGKRYIGSSQQVEKRVYWHLCMLRVGGHHCRKLQELWNISKRDDFDCYLIEKCLYDNDVLRDREQAHMDETEETQLLNMCKDSRSAIGYEHTDETVARMSAKAQIAANTVEQKLMRSERASRQHSEGKLGQKTWKNKKPPKSRICRKCCEEFVPEHIPAGYLSQSKYCITCRPIHIGGYYKNKQDNVGLLKQLRVSRTLEGTGKPKQKYRPFKEKHHEK